MKKLGYQIAGMILISPMILALVFFFWLMSQYVEKHGGLALLTLFGICTVSVVVVAAFIWAIRRRYEILSGPDPFTIYYRKRNH